MPTCHCGHHFSNANVLGQHQRTKLHGYCKLCDRTFRTPSGLAQDNSDLHNWLCGHCNRKFSAQESLAHHQRSTGHFYCRECNRLFFHCCDCDRDFVNEQALRQHLTDKTHKITRCQVSGYACEKCDRDFGDERALEQHQKSLAHQPLSNLKCVAGGSGQRECQKRFTSPSALLHHLESGACRSGMTRRMLNAVVQTNDVDRIISSLDKGSNDKLLRATGLQTTSSCRPATPTTDGSSTGDHFSPRILTPQSDLSESLMNLRSTSLSRVCPLCPSSRHSFSTAESLRQHLASPAHAPRIFHCPVFLQPPVFRPTTIKYFSTLSGLAQHLESGAYQGGMDTFHQAAKYIEKKLKKSGMTEVELLM
ncbi:putative zinc finger protein [Macrophomina phaseolina]|uniref:Zinc finger protein n=1 Tax=Macrophomina phaseolina TaxID=35725 RepID=A0ABQ8GSF3_9PEZI|nr:putative zinc finger protein [Macrophomina phaseolina]